MTGLVITNAQVAQFNKKIATVVLNACLVALVPPVLGSPVLFAQADAKGKTSDVKRLAEAHQAEFDYLLGDWKFTATNHQYGDIQGYWSAVRLGDGKQIMDEYRIVGDKGETYYSTITLRAFNDVRGLWDLVSLDKGTGLQNIGTGHREGNEMRIEQTFHAGDGTASVWRIRYSDIEPTSFSWAADRSDDGGKTWVKNFQLLKAQRIGPARTLDRLTPIPGANK